MEQKDNKISTISPRRVPKAVVTSFCVAAVLFNFYLLVNGKIDQNMAVLAFVVIAVFLILFISLLNKQGR